MQIPVIPGYCMDFIHIPRWYSQVLASACTRLKCKYARTKQWGHNTNTAALINTCWSVVFVFAIRADKAEHQSGQALHTYIPSDLRLRSSLLVPESELRSFTSRCASGTEGCQPHEHTHTHMYIHTCMMYTYIHPYIHTCMHTYIQTDMQTCIHTHACMQHTYLL